MKAIRSASPIHISEYENVKYWISHFLINGLGISEDQFRFIGSFGKKEFSSDIDIAILEESINLEMLSRIFDKTKIEYKIVKGFNQISFGYPFTGKILQVDLMLSKNLDWTEFIYYSPDLLNGESQYKGIYRNLLMSAILITESRIELEDGSISQIILRLNEGIVQVHKKMEGNVSVIQNEEFLTDDPKKFIEILGLSGSCLTLESIMNQILDRTNFNEIMERFNKFCICNKLELWDKQNA